MIGFTFKYIRPIALFLAVLVLFQCCKIYDKQPVSVEQAISEKRVKIITTDGKEYIFDNIYYKSDSLLYGSIKIKKSDTKEIIIPKNQIKEQVYNVGKHGGTDTFITVDGEEFNFVSYHFKNDTLYGQYKGRLRMEILLPTETIKEIYLYNSKKSITATVFLAIGAGWGIAALGAFIALIIEWSKIGGDY